MSRFGLLAVLSLLLLPAPASALDEPLRELHVRPGAKVPANLFVKAGRVYPMEVSGTARKVERNIPNDYELSDAFWCFESTAKGRCPPAARQPIQASILQTFVAGEFNFLWQTVDGPVPAYKGNHIYTFAFKPKKSGKLDLTTHGLCVDDGKNCTGEGFDVKIWPPWADNTNPCARQSRSHAAAVNEVRVVAVQPSVEYHKAGTPEDRWLPVCRDTVLQQGDEISCDPDGAVTLQFADNSTVVVRNTTQLKIASFFTEGGVVKTEILLKMGQVAAQIHKSEATKSDFRFKTPTGTASVRGTSFSVFYDPGGRSMLTTVREGLVEVDPVKGGLGTVRVPAGKEVEVGASSMSKVVAAGKAGARGGVNRRDAIAKVLKVIAKRDGPCGVRTPRLGATAAQPAARGWTVTVKLTGLNKGRSKWAVNARRAKPSNALAKRVARGCRS